MFISNNRASFHLWWNHQKVSKYYEKDCRCFSASSLVIGKFLVYLLLGKKRQTTHYCYYEASGWKEIFHWCVLWHAFDKSLFRFEQVIVSKMLYYRKLFCLVIYLFRICTKSKSWPNVEPCVISGITKDRTSV